MSYILTAISGLLLDIYTILDRDDRCIADNGREAWFPYLDEELVGFLQSLPIQEVRLIL